MSEFEAFPKIPRLCREIIVTEKIDGTNACVVVPENPQEPVLAQSRTRFVTPEADNYGFAAWVRDNADALRTLGPGRHFGEWWGRGINRNYGLAERRFALFNVSKWDYGLWERNEAARQDREHARMDREVARGKGVAPIEVRCFAPPPACCHVVPVLWVGEFSFSGIETALIALDHEGSRAAPGFANPEGIVIFHTAGGYLFKKTLGNDGSKGEQ